MQGTGEMTCDHQVQETAEVVLVVLDEDVVGEVGELGAEDGEEILDLRVLLVRLHILNCLKTMSVSLDSKLLPTCKDSNVFSKI